ncbi:MAG: hypothetical protein QM767_03780 [Anaeromyxobacter sp.]
MPVDEVMTTARLACGGTLAAAREALRTRGPAINLLGGFHHAGPGTAGGFCPVNDVAVARATRARRGCGGRVAVLDLDAHPPDGIAQLPRAGPAPLDWLCSPASDWGALSGVDETVLPEGGAGRRVPGRAGRPPLAHAQAAPGLRHRRRRRAGRRPLRASWG